MTSTLQPAPESPPRRTSRGAVALLLAAAALGGLTVLVAYGFATEYADTSAPAAETAVRSIGDWWFAVAVTAVPALVAAVVRRTPAVLVAGGVVVALTLLGVGAGAVLGAQQKYERYPATPNCTDEFDGGPAMAVTQAAQRAYESIEHPAPFSGGGSSGEVGCASELMVRGEEDPADHYRTALRDAGWTVTVDTDVVLRAEQREQAFELAQDAGGAWTVWIGPRALEAPSDQDGRVGG